MNSWPSEPPTRWLAVSAVLAAGVAAALNVGKVPVGLSDLRAEGQLSLVGAGWVSSTMATVAALGAAFAGMWVGRVGALRMVLLGLFISAGASLLATASGAQLWPLLMSRLLEGLGFTMTAVACPALVTAAAAAPQRRFALGLWSAYMPFGASLAMIFAPALLPGTGWRGLWVITALLMLLAATLVWRERAAFRGPGPAPVALQAGAGGGAVPGAGAGRGGPPPSAPASFFAPVRDALGQPLPWLLAFAFAAWAVQHFALIVWMPTVLKEQHSLPPSAVALLTGLMLMACVPGNVLGGLLVERGFSRGALIAWAQVGTGLGAVAYLSPALPELARYGASVFVSFVGGVIPAAVMASSTVLARGPQQIGTLQGLYMQGAQLGQFIGTPLIAAVVAATGLWRSSLWVTGGAALLGVTLGIAAQRLESKRHS